MVPPGYFWLAADWENLLPSCIDCNRERKKAHAKDDGTYDERKSGKANKFPLAPGSPRASRPGEHLQEQPLLLDPCTDDPGVHLRFTDSGMILPSEHVIEAQLPKGKTTIEVCGLDRDDLVGDRRTEIKHVKVAMRNLCIGRINIRKYQMTIILRSFKRRTKENLESLQRPRHRTRRWLAT